MKLITGQVIGDKMDKTIVVEVIRQWMHPKYKKTVKRTKKYLVHDEKKTAQIGDTVIIAESRPLSKNKHFTLKEVIKK